MPTPQLAARSVRILAVPLLVAATSPGNAWAVGYGGAQTTKTLILRWNGTSWTRS